MAYDEQLANLQRNDVWQCKRTGRLVWVFEVGKYFYVRFMQSDSSYPQMDYEKFINKYTLIGEL